MSDYFAAAVTRTGTGWAGRELDLDEVDDFDSLVDLLRDLVEDDADTDAQTPEPVLLLLEENDEYVGIVRVDGEAEPRCFLSDARVTAGSDLANLLRDNLESTAEVADDDEEPVASSKATTAPIGDSALLADLGVAAEELLDLCAGKGMLPADVVTVVAERLGCLETVEELRGV